MITAFCVDGQWYQMPYEMVRAIRHYLGPDYTNRAIVELIMARKSWYDFNVEGKVITIGYQKIQEG